MPLVGLIAAAFFAAALIYFGLFVWGVITIGVLVLIGVVGLLGELGPHRPLLSKKMYVEGWPTKLTVWDRDNFPKRLDDPNCPDEVYWEDGTRVQREDG